MTIYRQLATWGLCFGVLLYVTAASATNGNVPMTAIAFGALLWLALFGTADVCTELCE